MQNARTGDALETSVMTTGDVLVEKCLYPQKGKRKNIALIPRPDNDQYVKRLSRNNLWSVDCRLP